MTLRLSVALVLIASIYGCDPSDDSGDSGPLGPDASTITELDGDVAGDDAAVVADAAHDARTEDALDASEALDAGDSAIDGGSDAAPGCEEPEAPVDAASPDASDDAGEPALETPEQLNAIPDALWRAPPASLPSEGGYIYLASEPGEPVFDGVTQIFTLLDSWLVVRKGAGTYTRIDVRTDTIWSGSLAPPAGMTRLAPGYYTNTESDPPGALVAELEWGGDGRSCTTVRGWFAIDHVAYRDDAIVELDMRFEQYCDSSTAALRGQVHWMADDPTEPAGPIVPPPAGLWQASIDPPVGNYIHLQSDPGDYVGAGVTETYLGGTVSGSGNAIAISVRDWLGNLQGMWNLPRLVPGYYGNLRRYAFQNPAYGGLEWSGRGRGCNELSGWFVIDDITYECGSVTALDARLEIHCEHSGAALHVQIHYLKP